MILILLNKWLKCDDVEFKTKVTRELQGRPRLITSFIHGLAQCRSELTDVALKKAYSLFYYQITFNECNYYSILNYWMRHSQSFTGDSEAPNRLSTDGAREMRGVIEILKDLL